MKRDVDVFVDGGGNQEAAVLAIIRRQIGPPPPREMRKGLRVMIMRRAPSCDCVPVIGMGGKKPEKLGKMKRYRSLFALRNQMRPREAAKARRKTREFNWSPQMDTDEHK